MEKRPINKMILDEINNTLLPEGIKEWNGMNGGKQDLQRAHLQEMLERSCWIINNERSRLVVGLWNTSQNYEVTTGH